MKQYRKILIAYFLISSAFTLNAQESCTIGYVNVKKCVEKSKFGKRERNAFEGLKKQLGENLEKSDKELNDLAKKLEDQEYIGTLSSEAAEDLKQKFQKLSQEFVRYQNQYYQLLQQANMKLLQNLNDIICKSSEQVRQNKHLQFVLNDEAIFATDPSNDVSEDVIKNMDERFDQENKDKGEASKS